MSEMRHTPTAIRAYDDALRVFDPSITGGENNDLVIELAKFDGVPENLIGKMRAIIENRAIRDKRHPEENLKIAV